MTTTSRVAWLSDDNEVDGGSAMSMRSRIGDDDDVEDDSAMTTRSRMARLGDDNEP